MAINQAFTVNESGRQWAKVILITGVILALKKDWTWFAGAVVLAIGMGVVIGIVNASFTATV